MPPETDGQIEQKLEQARKRLLDLQHQIAAEKFVAANPSYEATTANQDAMQTYLRDNDFDPTYEGLERAYGQLKTLGRITVPTGVEDKATEVISAYQHELQERVRRDQEEIERGTRELANRPRVTATPANQYIQQQREQAQTRQPVIVARVMPKPLPINPGPIILTPAEKLRASLKVVAAPSGRRVKDVIIDNV